MTGGGWGTFGNPILGSLGRLIRVAIMSANYVAGVAGWRIAQNGDAELNDVIVRGEFDVSNPSGAHIRAYANGTMAEIDFQPPDSATPGTTFGPATITATSTADEPLLVVTGASRTAPVLGGAGQLNLGSDPVLNQTAGQLLAEQIVIGDPISSTATVEVTSQTVNVDHVLRVGADLKDVGAGMLAYAGSIVTSAAIGAVETSVLTTPGTVFRANRAYECRLTGRLAVSVANNAPQLFVHKTDPAGAVLITVGRWPCISTGEYAVPLPLGVFTVGNANVTAAIAFTLLGSGAFTVVHTGRRQLRIYDVGPASDYPDSAVLV